jgi:hypothetical protein
MQSPSRHRSARDGQRGRGNFRMPPDVQDDHHGNAKR